MANNNRHITEDELGYRLEIYGKHIDISDPIKDYIIEKLGRIERLTDLIIEVEVRIEVQKLVHQVDIVKNFSHFKVCVHANTDNMYSAIDKAFDRLQRKLYNWKTRIQEYHARKPVMVDMSVDIYASPEEELADINEEIEAQNAKQLQKEMGLPTVVTSKTMPLKTLRYDEAMMKIVLSGDNFLIYKDEVQQDLRIMYKRDDGTFGLITPVS